MTDCRLLTTADPCFPGFASFRVLSGRQAMKRQPGRAQGFMLRLAALLVVFGGTLAAGAAQAQSNVFGEPPRPPADVPGGPLPPQPPPVGAQFPSYPAERQPSAIQAQPLPPPPGAVAAPPAAQRARVSPPPANPPPQGANPPPQPANPPPPQPADTSPQPDDTVVTEMPSQKIPNGRAVFSGLDKITGRIISFDAAIGETVQFGALQVTARACYSRPPTETPLTDGFVEVDEVTLQGEVRRIFTGWMFAASPGLHAVEHAIYDVWLTDCKGGAPPAPVADAQPPPAAAPARPPPPRQGAGQRGQGRQQPANTLAQPGGFR
jgi:hypothetical protein